MSRRPCRASAPATVLATVVDSTGRVEPGGMDCLGPPRGPAVAAFRQTLPASSSGRARRPKRTAVERRKSPRFKARFDALYSSGAREGAGVLAEISYAGVRLEETSIRPELGTRVVLYIFVRPVQPFELVGHVARHTERGFALSIDPPSAEIRYLVDDVAALVTASTA